MYNSNWEANKDIITGLELYRVNNVIKYLHSMREFILVTAGKLSDSRVPVLKPDYMPNKDTRFPDDTLFLCEGYGEWSQYYHKLLLSVSTMLNHNRLGRDYTNCSTAGQTEEVVLYLIARILELIYKNAICMNRRVFESQYCLEWYYPESPQQRLQNRNPMNESMERVKNSSDQSNGDLQQQEEEEEEDGNGDSRENEGSSM